MRVHRLIFLCSVSFVCMCFSANRSFNFSWINVTCTDNPDIFRLVCELSESENGAVINYWGTVVKDIEDIHTDAYVDVIRTKQDNIRVVESHVDGCKFLKGPPDDMLAVTVFRLIQQFGQWPRKCPVKAPNNYTLENVFLDTAYLPPYTPEAVFSAELKFFTNGVQFLGTKIFGKVKHFKSRRTDLLSGRRG